MRKKGKVNTYNSFGEESLTYKLQQLGCEKRKMMGNLIRLCPQPLITYFYITLFQDELLVIPTIFFVLQMMVIIFDTPSCIRRTMKLKVLKEEVMAFLKKYEPQEVSDKEKTIIKKM